MVEIRPYTDADYEAVKRNLEEGGLFSSSIDTREILHAKSEIHQPSILVAAVKEEVVGNVYIVEDRWSSFIFRLAVRNDWRRQGIGSLLMEEAERRLREKGIKNIALFVRNNEQDLIEYYKKKRLSSNGYTTPVHV